MDTGEYKTRTTDMSEGPDIDWNKWEKVLKSVQKSNSRPPNSITSREYAEKAGLPPHAALKRLRALVNDGLAERTGGGNKFYYTLTE